MAPDEQIIRLGGISWARNTVALLGSLRLLVLAVADVDLAGLWLLAAA